MADISSWWREDRSDESSEEIHSSTPALRGTWEGVYGVCVCGGGGGGGGGRSVVCGNMGVEGFSVGVPYSVRERFFMVALIQSKSI